MRRRRIDPRQLVLEWGAATPAVKEAVSAPELVNEDPRADSLPLLQVLPWDFSAAFPPVLEDAIDAGVVTDEDSQPEGIKMLHAEHGRELLAALMDREKAQEARRRGVNSATGKAPRSAAKRQKLTATLDLEVQRLDRWWQTLLETYEVAFGAEAADAFGKYVRARHAGVEVMAMAEPLACSVPDLPLPKPLRRAVKTGVFGEDEHGCVDPHDEEVEAITQRHAERVTELMGAFRQVSGVASSADAEAAEQRVTEALDKYAADFGRKAADELLLYCRRQALLMNPPRLAPHHS